MDQCNISNQKNKDSTISDLLRQVGDIRLLVGNIYGFDCKLLDLD